MSKPKTTRVVVTPRPREGEIITTYQASYDEYDGTGPGHYACVSGLGELSDFVVGPCKTAKRAHELAVEKLSALYGEVKVR